MAGGNFAPNGDVTVYAGEPISVRIMHGDSDVGERTYVMTAYNPLNREPYVSVSVDVDGTDAELAFTGADTELLFRKSRKNLEIVQALSNGVRTITNGKLNIVARSNAPDPEATTGVTGVVNVITVGEDGRNVIVGSFGEPGQSPWQAAGQTYAQWLDENVSEPLTAAATSVQQIGEQVEARANEFFNEDTGPIANTVRTDIVQDKSEAEKARARANIAAPSIVATRAALAGLPAADGASASLVEPGTAILRAGRGRSGSFSFVAADCSAEVALDPQQGIYIPIASDPTGGSGAWKRIYEVGEANARWWGAKGDWTAAQILSGVADDSVAIQAAIDWCETHTETFKVLRFDAGNFVGDRIVASRVTLKGTNASRSLGAGLDTQLGTRWVHKVGATGNHLTLKTGDGWEEVSEITFQGFKTLNAKVSAAKAIVSATSRTQFTVAPGDVPTAPSNVAVWPFYGVALFLGPDNYIIGTAVIKAANSVTGAITIENGDDNYASPAGNSGLLTNACKVIFAPRASFTVSGFEFTDVSDSTGTGYNGIVVEDRTKVLRKIYIRDYHANIVMQGSVCNFDQIWSRGPTFAGIALRYLGAGSDYNMRGLFLQGYADDGLGVPPTAVSLDFPQYKTSYCGRWGLGAKEVVADCTCDEQIHGVVDLGSAGIWFGYLHIDKALKESFITRGGVFQLGLADATVHIDTYVLTTVGQNQTVPANISFPSTKRAAIAIRPGNGRIVSVGSLSVAPWSPAAPTNGYLDCITHIKGPFQGEGRVMIGRIGSLKGVNALFDGDYSYQTMPYQDSKGLYLRDSLLANANASGRLLGGGYSGNPFTALQMLGTAGVNELRVGGGTGLAEPASAITFYAGPAGALGAGTKIATLNATGLALGGSINPSQLLDIDQNSIRVRQSRTPATATSTGNQGQICWDANYLYVCTAPDTWRRTVLASW